MLRKTKNTSLAHIGSLITKLREDRGLTQAELGTKIGSTQSVIARIEKGEQNLSTKTLASLSKALNREIVSLAKGGGINFRIEGGRKLKGEITVRTSKNGALGVMCASLLNKGATTIKNAPRNSTFLAVTIILHRALAATLCLSVRSSMLSKISKSINPTAVVSEAARSNLISMHWRSLE